MYMVRQGDWVQWCRHGDHLGRHTADSSATTPGARSSAASKARLVPVVSGLERAGDGHVDVGGLLGGQLGQAGTQLG